MNAKSIPSRILRFLNGSLLHKSHDDLHSKLQLSRDLHTKRLRVLVVSAVFAIFGNALHAQNCLKGMGQFTGTTCCDTSGCMACAGSQVKVGNGATYKRQVTPCACVFNPATRTLTAEAQRFSQTGTANPTDGYLESPLDIRMLF